MYTLLVHSGVLFRFGIRRLGTPQKEIKNYNWVINGEKSVRKRDSCTTKNNVHFLIKKTYFYLICRYICVRLCSSEATAF